MHLCPNDLSIIFEARGSKCIQSWTNQSGATVKNAELSQTSKVYVVVNLLHNTLKRIEIYAIVRLVLATLKSRIDGVVRRHNSSTVIHVSDQHFHAEILPTHKEYQP